ncbi:RNA polymerase sigma factor [Falsirhodobacter sp. 20TX0035]|uniref:RNA polymerase sigma factor n=1 Tax=Falsirhodobacter sp. 20TX0035 TaxID=3022019 RepID=UPI002330C72C|nr:sigma-70 family RNA polymerase sigma factor [Falsirhodobacter sp. 20TX0035]
MADLVVRIYPRLLSRLRRTVAVDAEDVLHELYLRLARLPPTTEILRPRAYLVRAAQRLVIDRHRRAGRTDALTGDVADARPSVERRIDAARKLCLLRAAVETLPARQREAFVLARFENLGHAEIALRMGISISAVEKLLVKALIRCRAAVEDDA